MNLKDLETKVSFPFRTCDRCGEPQVTSPTQLEDGLWYVRMNVPCPKQGLRSLGLAFYTKDEAEQFWDSSEADPNPQATRLLRLIGKFAGHERRFELTESEETWQQVITEIEALVSQADNVALLVKLLTKYVAAHYQDQFHGALNTHGHHELTQELRQEALEFVRKLKEAEG